MPRLAKQRSISKTVNGYAQAISDYLVTVDSPGLFSVLPSIANDGTLTFTPVTDRNGIATVSVRVRDNGGTLNGGVDLSSAKTFIDPTKH